MTEPHQPVSKFDAVTTPVGITSICPQCGVSLDVLTTSCGRCGAVITDGGPDGERAEKVRQRLQSQIGGGYQLGALMGRGSMGVVFKAREITLERDVALKVLAFDPALNPEAFVRFEREARLAARLDHPNIVPIFAVGQGEGIAYYTMRFVRGGSVEGLLADQGALPLDHAVRLLRDVASALDVAHGQGVVHRDIKPANILLSDSGHAMVADFGIARAFGGDAATNSSASHTGVVGSPAYMAPEQWRGEKPDGRADQYALGVVAFELLAGRRPFRDDSMQELLRMHLGEEPPTLESMRKGLPANVSLAIQRAMAKEPSDRFPTATAFVDALAGDAAVGAVRTARRAPAVGRAAPSRRWVGYAVGALLLVAAGVPLNRYRERTLEQARLAALAQQAAAAAVANPAADSLSERLMRELGETRKIAVDAQRRAARAESMQKQAAAASAPAVPQVGHVGVMVRGGAPHLFIDDKEVAASTPAMLAVPPGRHIVRVAQAGRQYVPAQYVVNVAVGDTSRLQFSDPRMVNRDSQPLSQPRQPGLLPRLLPSVRKLLQLPFHPRGKQAAPQLTLPPSGEGMTSTNPFFLSEREWRQLSPQEQATARAKWQRLSPEQQRKAMRDVRQRDTTRVNVPRRPQP